MGDEIAQLQILIDAILAEMVRLQESQRKLGIPVTISKKFMDRVVEVQRQVDILIAKNKGYGTKAHIEGIKKQGICDIHRRTFVKKYI